MQKKQSTYGLIGKKLTHSFSPNYFKEKFERENIKHSEYLAFELNEINDFKKLLSKHKNLKGLNVTIPYKEAIIPFLDKLSTEAKAIDAVNTIQFKNNQLIGHNTDVVGFEQSLGPLLQNYHTSALILGTGGAAKAVKFVLGKLNISFKLVSRSSHLNRLTYKDLNDEIIRDNTLIINTTPIGMHPFENEIPSIPLEALSEKHLVYDLIYNPKKTLLLQEAEKRKANIKNGLEMLQLQAEASWKIWNA